MPRRWSPAGPPVDSPMRIEVRYFASLTDVVGTSVETVELEPGARVEDLWASLTERHPGLASLGFRPMVACDMEYEDWDQPLDGVREVAFLPPVSGG